MLDGIYSIGRKLTIFWGFGALVLFFDQVTKYLILTNVPLYSRIEVIPGFFNIVHVRNTGIAFSLFSGSPGAPFILGTIAFLAVIFLHLVVLRLKEMSNLEILYFGLILGGALGNLLDRIRLGSVVDFLDFYIGNLHWPAFNVADSAITCGALLLAKKLLLSSSR
ncbi:MAG: signal peptidase II [Syntrophobacterales bacterium]|nr:signal peptidase II [Syntrophobacterales bacterium]